MASARRFVLLGGPGVGKGTYGVRLSEWLGLPHIGVGDLVRDEIRRGTAIGKECAGRVHEGELVSDDISTFLLKWRLGRETNGYLLDGYPRRAEQVDLLEEIDPPESAILFTLREDVLIEKSLGRRVCLGCGANYNIANINVDNIIMPPLAPKKEGVCDNCGESLHQRQDDTLETIKHRLEIHKELSAPVESRYRADGRLKEFAVNGTPRQTFPRLQKWFSEQHGRREATLLGSQGQRSSVMSAS